MQIFIFISIPVKNGSLCVCVCVGCTHCKVLVESVSGETWPPAGQSPGLTQRAQGRTPASLEGQRVSQWRPVLVSGFEGLTSFLDSLVSSFPRGRLLLLHNLVFSCPCSVCLFVLSHKISLKGDRDCYCSDCVLTQTSGSLWPLGTWSVLQTSYCLGACFCGYLAESLLRTVAAVMLTCLQTCLSSCFWTTK